MDGLQWKTLLKWMIWGYHYFWKHPYLHSLHSLKLTVRPPEIRRVPKGNVVFQPLMFRGELAVSFREGILFSDIFAGFNMTYPDIPRCADRNFQSTNQRSRRFYGNLGDISNSWYAWKQNHSISIETNIFQAKSFKIPKVEKSIKRRYFWKTISR